MAAMVRAGKTVVVKWTSHPSSQIFVTVVISFRPTCTHVPRSPQSINQGQHIALSSPLPVSLFLTFSPSCSLMFGHAGVCYLCCPPQLGYWGLEGMWSAALLFGQRRPALSLPRQLLGGPKGGEAMHTRTRARTPHDVHTALSRRSALKHEALHLLHRRTGFK